MDGEVLYDENAMNNAYNLLVTANSNLEIAKDYYNNDKLSGSSLVSNAESVMNNVEQAIAKAAEALASIDVGMGSLNTDFSGASEGSTGDEAPSIIDFGMGPLNSDLFGVYEVSPGTYALLENAQDSSEGTYEVNSSEGTNAEGTTEGPMEWTPESVAEYKESVLANIEICDEMIEQASQDISDMKNELDGFLCLPVLYEVEYHLIVIGGKIATPEEYLQDLINNITARDCLDENGNFSQEIYEAKIKECKDMAEEYKVNFAAAFMAAMGESYESYEEFETKLNDANEVLTAARSAKYPLEQQKKLLPFLDIMATDEYKEFASQDHYIDLAKFRQWHKELYDYNSNYAKTEGSYITEEDEMFLLYLSMNEGTGKGLPKCEDYIKAIEDKVNKAKGEKECQELLAKCTNENGEIDWTAYNALVFGAEGFGDGVATFFDGLENCLRKDGIISDTQYKQMFLYQILGQDTVFSEDAIALQFCYENGSIIGNMAVPMLFSFALGPSGAGLLGASTAAGASSVLMGLSAGGNAKNQALVDGYSMPNAYLYGIFSALSESATNYFLGKIPFISQSSGLTLGNLFSEGLQEFTQEYYDAGLRAVLFGEEIDLRELTGDALKSFVMGAIVAGELNGLQAITVMTQAGETVDIPFSEIEALCKANPEMSVLEAATVLMSKKYFRTDNIYGYNQSILDDLFTDNVVEIQQDGKDIVLDFINKYKIEFYTSAKKKGWNDDQIVNMLNNLDKNYISFEESSFLSSFIFDCCRNSPKKGDKFAPWDIFNENISRCYSTNSNLNADVTVLREAVIAYFKEKGMSAKETMQAFSCYNWRTGGVCNHAVLDECLCEKFTEEIFKEHFGFDRDVYLDGRKLFNPLLLADMIFEMNKQGAVENPDFVMDKNGNFKLKNGKIGAYAFSNAGDIVDLDGLNRYLAKYGLKAIELSTQAMVEEKGPEVSGIPSTGLEISPDYVKFLAETALRDGDQMLLGITGGRLINVETGEVMDFTNKGHITRVVGVTDKGLLVNTFGGKWLYPYTDMNIFTGADEDGNPQQQATVGWSILDFEELEDWHTKS